MTSFIDGLRVINNPNLPDGVIILHGGKCPACGGRGYIFSMVSVGGATTCPGRHCFGGELMLIVREGSTWGVDHQKETASIEAEAADMVAGVQKADRECLCEGEFTWACGPECECWHHQSAK